MEMERHFKAKPKYTCWSYGSLTSMMVSVMRDEAEKVTNEPQVLAHSK